MTTILRGTAGLLLAVLALCNPAAASPHPSTYHPNQLLIKFRTESFEEQSRAARLVPGSRLKASMPRIGWHLLELAPELDLNAMLEAYRNRPDVLFAEPNYRIRLFATPNDPRWPDLWNLETIDAPKAWDDSTGSAEIVVAILDTGLDFKHADIGSNVWTNPGEFPANNYDDDGNGYKDDVHGPMAGSGGTASLRIEGGMHSARHHSGWSKRSN